MTAKDTDRMPEHMLQLLLEAGRIFHKMRVLGRRLGAVGEEGGGNWGLMRSLMLEGPRTVPQLARSRPVARQHIQTIVNELREEGFVRLIDNPAHKRSKLVELTPEGEIRYQEIETAILAVTGELGRTFSLKDVMSAVQTLSDVSVCLDARLEQDG